MCYAAAIMAAVQIGGSLVNGELNGRASSKAIQQNVQNQIRQYGTTVSNLNIKAIDEAMSYRQQMTANEFARYQTMGNINQQIQEGNIKGQSMRRTKSLANAQFTRQNADLMMNYDKAYANLENEKLNQYLGVSKRLKDVQESLPDQKKLLKMHFGLSASMAMGQYTQGMQEALQKSSRGLNG